jgi:hypothetical protein
MSKKIYVKTSFHSLSEFLKKNIVFDLINGPYINGSSVLIKLERLFFEPDYVPEDIDIVCTNLDQKNHIIETVCSAYSTSTRPEENSIGLDFSVVGLCAKDYFVDCQYTVNQTNMCNKYLLLNNFTLNDIKNKQLNCSGVPNNQLKKKLISRGYHE